MIGNRLSFVQHFFVVLCLLAAGDFQYGCNPFTQAYYEQELEGPMSKFNDRIFSSGSDTGVKVIKAWQEYNLIVSDYLKNEPKPDYVKMQGKEHLYFYYPRKQLAVHFRRLP